MTLVYNGVPLACISTIVTAEATPHFTRVLLTVVTK